MSGVEHPVCHGPLSDTAVFTLSRELFGCDYWKVLEAVCDALMIMADALTPAGFEGSWEVGGRKGGVVFVIMRIIIVDFCS